MAAAIGPGDFVEVVKCRPDSWTHVGAVHRVTAVNADPRPCQDGHAECFGLQVTGDERFFAGCCFRPIYPGGDLTRLLLVGIEDRQRHDELFPCEAA